MHQHSQPGGVELSHALKMRILDLAPFTLDELFAGEVSASSPTLDHLRKVTRLKIIEVFSTAGGASRGTVRRPIVGASYVLSGEGTVSGLATAIDRLLAASHDFVIRAGDLPPVYRGLAKQWRDSVRACIQHLLLLEAVEELRQAGAQLWYFEGDQQWMVAQSLIDQYGDLLRDVKSLPRSRRRIKRDQRAWHGRPACQRGRVMEGVSVGYAA